MKSLEICFRPEYCARVCVHDWYQLLFNCRGAFLNIDSAPKRTPKGLRISTLRSPIPDQVLYYLSLLIVEHDSLLAVQRMSFVSGTPESNHAYATMPDALLRTAWKLGERRSVGQDRSVYHLLSACVGVTPCVISIVRFETVRGKVSLLLQRII